MSLLSNKYIGLEEFKRLHDKLERNDIYISPEWFEILSESYNVQLTFLITLSQSEIRAVTPLLVTKKTILKFVGSPLKGFYSDFMGTAFIKGVPESEREDIILSVIVSVQKLKPDYSEFRFKAGRYEDIFVHHGYEVVHTATLFIKTDKTKDMLWEGMESRARNMVRKAEKNGIQVEFSKSSDFDVNEYHQILLDTFKRQNTPLRHPKEFFISLLKDGNAKYVIPVVARLGEEMVSAAIFLHYEDTLVYLSGVSTNKGNQLSASSLIQWKIISFASENKISTYDMGGLGIPSIDKFKMSFGGYRVEKHFYVKSSWLMNKIEPLAKWALSKGIMRF
jgi:lipid II:glycine glycyltransferase (peptidoglycan interpeptide bridge formation enzyme)